MPKSKNKRKTHLSSQGRVIRKHSILNRLVVSDTSLNNIMKMNRLALVRFQLGTATKVDACSLFTLLSVSQLLSRNFKESDSLQNVFTETAYLLAKYNAQGNLTPEQRSTVVENVEVALQLWSKCTVEEVVDTCRVIRDGKYTIDDLFFPHTRESHETTDEVA